MYQRMEKLANSDIIIEKKYNGYTRGTDYKLSLHVLFTVGEHIANVPDTYVAATLIEELRRFVNSSGLEDVVIKKLEEPEVPQSTFNPENWEYYA